MRKPFSMKSMHQSSKFSRGFTLVEMLVVAPIVIILIGTIIYAIIQLTGEALSERASAQLIGNVQSSLDRIEEDVKPSGAFLAQNNITITSPQGLNNSTQAFSSVSGTNNSIILNTFVTDANPNAQGRNLVYLANTPYACGAANTAQNQVMTMNTVYFTKENASGVNQLWRRTLAVSGYTSRDCAGVTPWQRPSCAPGITGTLCVTQDDLLLSGVQSFDVQYFNSPSDTTPSANAQSATTSTRQSALDLTNTVQVTIKARITSAGREINQQGTIRVTRAGSLVKYAP